MSLLYNKDNGIGLNIYRYNLGAGSAGDKHISIANRQTECFLNKDGTYNFSADASAQKALQSAKAACGENLRVTLFANSPPVSMTKNGAGYGSPLKNDEEWVTNMDSTKYSAYADYLYKCTEYFVSEGYRVTDVSPVNEPQYSWAATYNDDGTYSAGQEGCHYSKTEVRDLMNVMVDRFSGSELETKNDVRVSMKAALQKEKAPHVLHMLTAFWVQDLSTLSKTKSCAAILTRYHFTHIGLPQTQKSKRQNICRKSILNTALPQQNTAK